PWGYSAHAPGGTTDNGTIAPTAALSSMPYTPEESLGALIHFYREHGEQLWGEYGFHDAFNLRQNWFADSYLAIDQGPIVNMIENHRSGLLWSLFMSNPEIAPALEAIGFAPNPTSTREAVPDPFTWSVFPSPSDGNVTVDLALLEGVKPFTLRVISPDGRTYSSVAVFPGLQFKMDLKHQGVSPGLCFLRLELSDGRSSIRPVVIK